MKITKLPREASVDLSGEIIVGEVRWRLRCVRVYADLPMSRFRATVTLTRKVPRPFEPGPHPERVSVEVTGVGRTLTEALVALSDELIDAEVLEAPAVPRQEVGQ